ncbi:MAG: XRE family transcriptional regulator [Brevundimonas sp.]|nr:MAG: XRE family transcriptional regulator [Brevundimonas sp.]
MSNAKAPRSPSDIAFDNEVGARIRAGRLAAGMTQSVLAKQAGVTFQQMQKYEKGINRVAASRLSSIATALGLPPSHFMDTGLEAPAVPADAARVLSLYAQCTEAQKAMVRKLLESMTGKS